MKLQCSAFAFKWERWHRIAIRMFVPTQRIAHAVVAKAEAPRGSKEIRGDFDQSKLVRGVDPEADS